MVKLLRPMNIDASYQKRTFENFSRATEPGFKITYFDYIFLD